MNVTAKLSNLRVSPRKVRLAADLIRGMDVKKAQNQLNFLVKKTALPILKLLNSAIANAKHNFKLNPDDLYIAKITVDGGPVLKRIMPRAMGRAFTIRKRTSHINLTLAEKKDKNQSVSAKTKKSSRTKVGSKSALEKESKNTGEDVKTEKIRKPNKNQIVKTIKDKPKRLTGLAKRAFK